MNIEIANRLVNLRKSNHLSQEALAEKLGISRQAVSKWERAEASPDTDNLILLARLYHVSLDELLKTDEEILIEGEPGSEYLGTENLRDERNDSAKADGLEEESLTGIVFPEGREDAEEDKYIREEKDLERGTYLEREERLEEGKRFKEEESSEKEKDIEEEEEYVDIGLRGVHVKDKDGSEVHIGWDGIHVEDRKKGDDVHIDKKGVYVNGEKYERKNFFYHWNFAGFICLLYFVLGVFFNAWHPAWMLFLLVPVWYSFIAAVRKKNANIFAYPILVTVVYLCAGFLFDAWHPAWILYLSIPVYYSYVSGRR